jgi:hypothetical protein
MKKAKGEIVKFEKTASQEIDKTDNAKSEFGMKLKLCAR